ncbi:MAG: N-acetylmuramoyl-L-alanine amidase [Chitinophagia bacterium]|nr:N-acetylmuramoyl-L-alanine amidase [Chitinophagia bacterium]
MKKRVLFKLIIAFIAIVSITQVRAQQLPTKPPKLRTIIIDAGHGGTEPGAKGTYSTEAQITLQLALRLDTLLRAEMPDVRFVMTRTTDIFHNPREKANIANRENGDLFLCIHVNAMPPKKEVIGYKTVAVTKKVKGKKKKVYQKVPIYRYSPNPTFGTSTYVWAADRSDEKSQGIIVDERYESSDEVMDVPDINSPEAVIKARLWSQKFFKNSVRLASMIEDEFASSGRKSWGVLQRNNKGIWVLQATNMPAVLVETGFITNKEEEDYLNSESGQKEVVRSIANAVIKYKQMIDGKSQ